MKGHQLLRAWFSKTKTKISHFAESCGVSRQTAHRWLRGVGPREVDHWHAIAQATGGEVPIGSWLERPDASA